VSWSLTEPCFIVSMTWSTCSCGKLAYFRGLKEGLAGVPEYRGFWYCTLRGSNKMTGLRRGFRLCTMCFSLTLEAYSWRSRCWMTSCGT
jgi:hypothetical protein